MLLSRSTKNLRIELAAVAIITLILVFVLPALNAYGAISNYTINLWGKYLCYALLAISVDLLWGYTGLLSLGQALFFSLGGYMLGMHLMLMIGEQGTYAKSGNNPNLIPDFMVFQGHTVLPEFWQPFYSFGFTCFAIFAVPALLAWIFGYLAFRARIKGVYFSILTQALTYCGMLIFFQNATLMGGNNGFTDYKSILGHDILSPSTQRTLFVCTAIGLVLTYLFCRWLSGTKFGLVQQAIRDGENRVLFSGYASSHFKLFIFVLASAIAAFGGALFVPQVGIINPEQMRPEASLEAVVWVAIGGRGTLLGPIIGAISVNALKSWATTTIPDLWLILLGVIFILVVLFLPGGLVSLPARLKKAFSKSKPEHSSSPESKPQPTSA